MLTANDPMVARSNPLKTENLLAGRNGAARADQTDRPGILRQLCLSLSNAILQFPLVFELQQRALNQPTLLRREVEEELERIAASGTAFKILDYGCGSGTYTGLFPPDCYLGIDCNTAMLERASNQHPQHAFVAATNLTGIRQNLEEISEVLMIGVVHHLSEEDCVAILKSLPRKRPVHILTIDTLKCTGGPGWLVQLFERGEFLRTESEHKRLLARVAEEISYKKVPYGNHFELAVFRGILREQLS